MRVNVIVILALLSVLLVEGTNCGSYVEARPKPNTRGFQPKLISTAYGFGKREITKQDKYGRIRMLLLQNFPESLLVRNGMLVRWLLHEIEKNPELGKLIVREIMDGREEENSVNLPTAELVKSERTTFF